MARGDQHSLFYQMVGIAVVATFTCATIGFAIGVGIRVAKWVITL